MFHKVSLYISKREYFFDKYPKANTSDTMTKKSLMHEHIINHLTIFLTQMQFQAES